MTKLLRYITLFLCALLVLPMQVHAAEVYTEGYLEYRIEDSAASICGYFGSENEVTVPASIAGYPVSEISAGAFADAETVKKINLPDTIMRIEKGAFGREQTVVYDSNTSDPKPTVPDDVETPEDPGVSSESGSSVTGSGAAGAIAKDDGNTSNDSSDSGKAAGEAGAGSDNSADAGNRAAGDDEAEVSLEDAMDADAGVDGPESKEGKANRISAGVYAGIFVGIVAVAALAVIIVKKIRKKKS